MALVEMDDKDADRFWSKVDVRDMNGCHEWIAGKDSYGYGGFWLRDQMAKTHRVAWELLVGPIPKGKVIDHMCHNPACVNVDHLRVVDAKTNNRNRKGANKNSKTGVRGVSRRKDRGTYAAQFSGKKLGTFATIDEARTAVELERQDG